jgi:transcription initiation factor IIE alpha subunit
VFIDVYDSNFRCARCNAILKPVDSASEGRQIQSDIEVIKTELEKFGPLPMSLKNVG